MIYGFSWENKKFQCWDYSDHEEGAYGPKCSVPMECQNVRNFHVIILKFVNILKFGRRNMFFNFEANQIMSEGVLGQNILFTQVVMTEVIFIQFVRNLAWFLGLVEIPMLGPLGTMGWGVMDWNALFSRNVKTDINFIQSLWNVTWLLE